MDVLNRAAEEEAARKDEKPHPMTVEEAVAKACEVGNTLGYPAVHGGGQSQLGFLAATLASSLCNCATSEAAVS